MAHEDRPRTLDPDNLGGLEAWLAGRLEADSIKLGPAKLLSGGAIGENWRLGADVRGGAHEGTHVWVLRTDAHSRVATSHQRHHEFACLLAAHQAGVTVPEPIAECDDASVIGAPFMVVGYAPGVGQARRIVRDPKVDEFGEELVERLGAELAKIHSIKPPREDLGFLEVPEGSPALTVISDLQGHLDLVSKPQPALEYVLRWLQDNAPPQAGLVLVHSDYRTGNYMVDAGQLTAILDWEFTHWGDAHEDVGWFCAKCWRFGADAKEAGGVGSREAFYRGYNAVAETPIDPSQVPYWEIMAAARWAVVALLQGERHHSGEEESLELILTGLMAPEMAFDALSDIAALGKEARMAASA